jgi:hypothetical protein
MPQYNLLLIFYLYSYFVLPLCSKHDKHGVQNEIFRIEKIMLSVIRSAYIFMSRALFLGCDVTCFGRSRSLPVSYFLLVACSGSKRILKREAMISFET